MQSSLKSFMTIQCLWFIGARWWNQTIASTSTEVSFNPTNFIPTVFGNLTMTTPVLPSSKVTDDDKEHTTADHGGYSTIDHGTSDGGNCEYSAALIDSRVSDG